MTKQLLVEHMDLELISGRPLSEAVADGSEDASLLEEFGTDAMLIEGVFQRADTKNANGRVYPRKLWDRLLSESSMVKTRMRERAMIGHLEHPKDGMTDLAKGAILVLGARMTEDGAIIGKALVYKEYPGSKVQEYVRTKTKIGISSRGAGTVDKDGVVQEDFDLETWDIVYNPSTPGAFPRALKPSARESAPAPVALGESFKELNMPPANATVTEAVDRVRAVEARYRPLIDADITGASKLSLSDLDTRLAEAHVDLQQRAAAEPAIATLLSSIRSEVDEKRTAVRAAIAKPVSKVEDAAVVPPAEETVVDESEESVEEGAEIEDPLSLLAEARDLIVDFQTKLEASSGVVENLRTSRAEIAAERDLALDQLDAANGIISKLTRLDVGALCAEKVEEVIASNSLLTDFRDVLQACKTPEAVSAKAESLAKRLAKVAPKVDEAVAPPAAPVVKVVTESAEPTPPKGGLRSEEDAGEQQIPKPVVSESVSRIADLAARAVARISG